MGCDGVAESFVAFIRRLADAAAPVVRRYFRRELSIEQKADASPVTVADREIEAVLRGLIEEEYPRHGIIGEEYGRVRTDAEYVWVIDPIDGTKAFICGVPMFGTLVALTHEGRPVLGVLDQCVLGERWVGGRGRGTTLNGVRARTRRCESIAEARLCTSSPDYFRGLDLARFERLRARVGITRYGTSCYGYGLLASGHIDVVMDAGLDVYDYMAQVTIIEEAGGIMSDWEGRPLDLGLGASRVLAAGDRRVHEQVLALIK